MKWWHDSEDWWLFLFWDLKMLKTLLNTKDVHVWLVLISLLGFLSLSVWGSSTYSLTSLMKSSFIYQSSWIVGFGSCGMCLSFKRRIHFSWLIHLRHLVSFHLSICFMFFLFALISNHCSLRGPLPVWGWCSHERAAHRSPFAPPGVGCGCGLYQMGPWDGGRKQRVSSLLSPE